MGVQEGTLDADTLKNGVEQVKNVPAPLRSLNVCCLAHSDLPNDTHETKYFHSQELVQ
jgi:hypothetical protein